MLISDLYRIGRKNRKKRNIFICPGDKKVIIPDIEKMYQNICEKELQQEFINYMMDNTPKDPSIGQWLQKHQFNEVDYERWKKYELDGGEAFSSRTSRPKEIEAFVKKCIWHSVCSG